MFRYDPSQFAQSVASPPLSRSWASKESQQVRVTTNSIRRAMSKPSPTIHIIIRVYGKDYMARWAEKNVCPANDRHVRTGYMVWPRKLYDSTIRNGSDRESDCRYTEASVQAGTSFLIEEYTSAVLWTFPALDALFGAGGMRSYSERYAWTDAMASLPKCLRVCRSSFAMVFLSMVFEPAYVEKELAIC